MKFAKWEDAGRALSSSSNETLHPLFVYTDAPLVQTTAVAVRSRSCSSPRGAVGKSNDFLSKWVFLDVVTRPTNRDAPHLFGLGLQEMLADEITAKLRGIRDKAV